MKKFFNCLWRSIKDFSFYKEHVKGEMVGGAFKYLIGLVLVLSFIFMINMAFSLRSEPWFAHRLAGRLAVLWPVPGARPAD